LLQFTAPGFFFFFRGLGEVSEGECPLEEWVGLDTLRFCGAPARSADPGGSGTGYTERIAQQEPRVIRGTQFKAQKALKD